MSFSLVLWQVDERMCLLYLSSNGTKFRILHCKQFLGKFMIFRRTVGSNFYKLIFPLCIIA